MPAESFRSESLQLSRQSDGNEDDTLRAAALKLLQSSGYAVLRSLRCEVREAVVMIHGVVPSYYLKQMAQAIIQRLDGIQGVRNLVEVRGTEVGRAEHSEEDTFPSHTVEAGATSSDERQLYCPAGDN